MFNFKWFLAVASILVLLRAPHSHAQTGEQQPAATSKGGATAPSSGSSKSSSPKKGGEGPKRISSVSPSVLSLYADQTVEVEGIIGDFIGSQNRYWLNVNDGSRVEVVGDYPKMSHTTWRLTARVGREGDKYTLFEKRKERVTEEVPISIGELGKGNTPLIIAGSVLILAALITLIVMSARNKAAEQKRIYEQQLESERRRREEAQREAERQAQLAASKQAQRRDHSGTVEFGAGGAGPVPRDKTIVSVGSLQVLGGPHNGEKFPVVSGETRIGRKKEEKCDVVLDRDGEVSAYHGSIIVTIDGRVRYRDASTNGSIVAGKPVHQTECDVHSGSQIEIGASTLLLTMRTTAPSADSEQKREPVSTSASLEPVVSSRRAETINLAAPTAAKGAPPTSAFFGAELEVKEGPDRGRRYPICKQETTLGREERDILFSDESVSRRHASLRVKEGKFVLSDDASTHGTRVNGTPVLPEGTDLSDGDEIVLGSGRTIVIFHRVGKA